jgi:ubiquitin related modifier 1
MSISLRIEFGGGLELLFANQRSHTLSIPATVPQDGDAEAKAADIAYLIHYLRDHLLKERPELFIENGTVSVSLASRA